MKNRIWIFLLLCSSSIFGLEVKPDSLSFTLKLMSNYYNALDTITLYNTSADRIQVDSVYIRFLNGVSTDFTAGKGLDPTQFSQYNYQGWVYGGANISLRYVKDSLFLLQDSVGNPLHWLLQPGDSLLFGLRVVVNCPVCGRKPSFPGTTRFLYSFIAADGRSVPFLLNLYQPVGIPSVRKVRENKQTRYSGSFFNLCGRKIEIGRQAGVRVRANEMMVQEGSKP
jgi:hypothetical protein